MERVEGYTIGINLEVKGDATEKFEKLIRQTQKLSERMLKLTESFKLFNETVLKSSTIFDGLTDALVGMEAKGTAALRGLRMEASALNRQMEMGGAVGAKKGWFGGLISGAVGLAGGMAGSAVMGAGYIGYEGFKVNSEIQGRMAQLQAQGFGSAFSQRAYNYSMASNLPGVSHLAMLQAINEAATVTKNKNEAIKLAPMLAQMKFANQAIFSQEGRSFTDVDEFNLLKAAEIVSGKTTYGNLSKTLNSMESVYSMEGGNVRSGDLLGFARRAASIIPGLSQSGLFALIPLIQDMSGHTVGSTLRVMTSQLLRGQNFRTGKRARMELHSLGITDQAGLAADKQLLLKDPVAWFNKVVMGNLESHGFKTMGAQKAELFKLFSGTVPNLMVQILQDEQKIGLARQTGKNAYGVKGAFATALNLPEGKIKAMEAAWNNLMAVIGKMDSPAVQGGIVELTRFLNYLATLLPKIAAELGGLMFKGVGLFHEGVGKAEGLWDKIDPFRRSTHGQTIHTSLYIDHNGTKKIAEAVTEHQNLQAEHQMTTGNGLLMNWFTSGMPTGVNNIGT